MTTDLERPAVRRSSSSAWALRVYCALLAYGTLFPVSGWEVPAAFGWRSLLLAWPEYISRIDLLTNFFVYVPLGALWVRRSGRPRAVASVLAATLVGAALSYGLECVQILLPRVPSRLDLLVNTLGSSGRRHRRHPYGGEVAFRGAAARSPREVVPPRPGGGRGPAGARALGALTAGAVWCRPWTSGISRTASGPLWDSLHGASSFDTPHAGSTCWPYSDSAS